MKRVFITLSVLAITLFAIPAVSIDVPTDSVRAIAVPTADGDGYGILRNICTASAIGDGTKWLSAAHCVADPRFRYYINGEQVQVFSLDDKNDLVILSTKRSKGKPLALSKVGPQIGQSIVIFGHPLGYEELLQSVGNVMGYVKIIDPVNGALREYVVVQAAGAPGNSGSAILNLRGEIVSVVQIGWSRSFSPVLGGVSFDTLLKFLKDAKIN